MNTTSAESRDCLRQAIDDEITSLKEATRTLKSRRNALALISRLPHEILTSIFSFLSSSAWHEEHSVCGSIAWISIAHVCRRWREIALNYPRLWGHINFTKLTPAAMAEILARAKMVPLHLEADATRWSVEKRDGFERQLEAHISHIRHLSFSGLLHSALQQLASPAPALEFLSLSHILPYLPMLPSPPPKVVIPVSIFDHTAPNLTSLKLVNCDISWKSPLLRGLRTLEIRRPSKNSRPKLEDWLNALNEMPQLETLHLEYATPFMPQATRLISEPSRTVLLPSLTGFCISASAEDCVLAFAHLLLPALTWLHVEAESLEMEGEDVRLVIPYVSRNVYRLLGTDPLRSILLSGGRKRAEVLAWTMPDADDVHDLDNLFTASVPAPLKFAATGDWDYGVDTTIFDALLTLLPVDSVSTLTVQRTRLSKEFWLSHAPGWPLLERARLVPTAVKAFRDILAEDAPSGGPRLPTLTKLILVDVTLTAARTYHLWNMLIKRGEQGVPLEILDLRLCYAADRAIQLFKEIVADVQVPLDPSLVEEEPVLNWYGGTGHCNEVEYDDGDEDEDEESDGEYLGDYDPDDYMRWVARRHYGMM